jgi:HSP20 family molecular chaperone IbpA
MSELSFSSSSTEELSLPYDADMRNLTKEIKDGILKISVPKRKKF